jgi:dihydroxy-acid dehydratase
LSDEELAIRKKKWKQPQLRVQSGSLYKYAQLVSSASKGCVTDATDIINVEAELNE